MIKAFTLLLFCTTCFGQLTMQQMQPFFSGTPSSARWWPTNTTSTLVWWADITPINGTYGEASEGNPHPVANNHTVLIWTNFAQNALKWSADQTLHPTNFTSGGGGNGTSPRLLFTAATSTRMVPGSTTARNLLTFIAVCNCTDTVAPTSTIFRNASSDPWLRFTGGNALEMNAGSTVTGPATLIAGTWYVVTAVFNGASSEIYTNGVLYKTGNAGSDTLTTPYLAQFDTPGYRGNISRFWGWTNVLSAGELTSAANQCKTDFGIP